MYLVGNDSNRKSFLLVEETENYMNSNRFAHLILYAFEPMIRMLRSTSVMTQVEYMYV